MLTLAIEQLGNSRLPYPPLPFFFFFLKETLPIHPPGETAHVIKSLPCQLIHGFINIQMCYQTGSRSSGRVRRGGGGLSVYFALVYCSINYPAVDAPRNNATHHQAPVNHQKYTHPHY